MIFSALPGAAENAPRPQSAGSILTPTTDSALNRRNGSGPPSSETRGGKPEGSLTMEHLLRPTIAVKPHPPNLHVPPRVLHPLMLLPRESLPLACVDCTGGGDLGQSRFFEARVRILDLESRMGCVPVVLIARYGSRGTVYALERQKNGLYVICKLGAWVNLDELAEHATAVAQQRLHPAKTERRDHGADAALTTPLLHHEHKKKRAAIEAIQSLVKKRTRSVSTSLDDAPAREILSDPDVVSQIPSPEVKLEEPLVHETQAKERLQDPHHTADDIFNNIRSHYFGALYKSLGSLAYFAKGPLSRARSAFHLDLESNLDMDDLIEFLKGLILTTVQIDKKYRETMPALLAQVKGRVNTSDEESKKKRRPKKTKIGRDGLYPCEDESIRGWWMATKAELGEHEAEISASQIKSHVSILRTRETQLQMIIIMEILALESLRVSTDPGESVLPGLDIDSADHGASLQPKKRNKHNLPVLLDVHADRLTIWQSTATDEQLLLEDSQSARVLLEGTREKKTSSEPLKDFCVDVVVPFFSARLPDLCDSINRKLGGPTIMTPAKAKSLKRPSSRDQKAGSVVQRPTPQNSRRTLQRALSTDQQNRRSVSRGPSNAIALMRSATSTTIPSIKREAAESPLLRTMQSSESLKGRGTLSRSSSMSSLRDPRSSKRAEVEAELKEAISTLRKPNRDAVGKAMAEADERRSSGLLVKKIRKPAVPAKVVKATPANNRFKDVMARKSMSEASQSIFIDSGVDAIPPSSVGRVTGWTEEAVGDTPIKQALFIPRSAIKTGGQVDDSVGATPMKKPTRRLIFGNVAAKEKPSIYETLGWDDDFDDLT